MADPPMRLSLTGAVLAERIARCLDQTILLIDRRDHIAGNAYDYADEDGILVHRYGPHTFHTNDCGIVDYLSQFTQWRPYEHRVLGMVGDIAVPVPINYSAIERLLGADALDAIRPCLEAAFGTDRRVTIQKLQQAEDPEIRELADFIFRTIFLGYTLKQWDLSPDPLFPVRASPRSGPARLRRPVFCRQLSDDAGRRLYRGMVARMIYTGALDALHGYRLGALPYET